MVKPIIAPSMLSSNFADLANEAQRMIDDGADRLHMDVMDGHFVPNITIGAPVIKMLKASKPNAFLDCHLMVSKPEKWIDDFAKAGADLYTFHIEAATDKTGDIINKIKEAGMKVGVAIKPHTPVEWIIPYADKIDMVLVMTVEPGFGSQKLIESCLSKCTVLRKKFPQLDIEIDGGINVKNIDMCSAAGANVIVAGTGIFKHPKPSEAISIMKNSIQKYC
ncbi:Ribulose-phosphate 3-epimerase [Neocallimastix lanati (nom. inval.)]|jgi:ribulose-phosphate 3-epimerase|uniref:Ribulose-phosphate 3-epimerase n=1 Tax=Neocallimastix californiae TaxID=1754190 RepID=A0A1Y2ASG2_9FUNG|nr:Ribulose-phosphate 3-epimerase [Neocallimastix sp. JGI-2020a]ORY25503.1 Ribulose-phosphate 3-epimerase [Neocallimastix californiae]|eukprot:ORY25503.1 Ribulose-phosphate 3-epimerase [Neocallimastix californiae]